MIQAVINSPDIVHQALLPLDRILISQTNPRKHFNDATLAELADSIEKVGVLQPILVRPYQPKGAGLTSFELHDKYEIVAGERRYRAARIVVLEAIPVVIRELTDLQAIELQVIENLHRTDLHPLEESEGFHQLLEANGYTPATLAEKIGKSKAYVYASLKLCALSDDARKAFLSGKFKASTALLLARIPGAALQAKALKELTRPIAGGLMPSYRDAVAIIRRSFTTDLNNAVFPLADKTLVPFALDCLSCEKRSGNCRDIYTDIDSADVCTDPDCYTQKREAHMARLLLDPNTISGDAAKELMPHNKWHIKGDDYAQPDAACGFSDGEGKKKHWEDLLGDELPTRTVVVEGRDPVVVVDVAAARQLAEEMGYTAQEEEPDELTPEQLARNAAQAAKATELDRRKALLSVLHSNLVMNPSSLESALTVAMPILLANLLGRLSYAAFPALFAARLEPESEPDSDTESCNAYLGTLSPWEMSILLVELTVLESEPVATIPYNWKPEDTHTVLPDFYAVLRAAGIDPEQTLEAETPTDPTQAAHAEIEIAREEKPADITEPVAQTAAQADEPNGDATPEATPIEAADKPAAQKRGRGRPRKQAVETPVAEVAQ